MTGCPICGKAHPPGDRPHVKMLAVTPGQYQALMRAKRHLPRATVQEITDVAELYMLERAWERAEFSEEAL